ncbi:hypothetical protein CYMTET_48548 [Cymbomonas tetramitiformis]|uniref:Uncharacterized protein n=1 Tax=Cymbomonas tetramitiformis TaxID=36881 RepID=A0AAE0BT55_9CHLO|nr:hypothetical protein CYMTET_48548 [Cymbomonas tetramitiformis]
MRRARSYGVLFRHEVHGDVQLARCYFMDLRASLVVFPDTHSACYLPFSDTPAEDEWLLPYVMPEAGSASTHASGDSISFSHISMALAETLYDRTGADLPCPGGYRRVMSLPDDGPEWEAAITLREIQSLVDDGKMVPVDSYPEGEVEINTTLVLTKPWKPQDNGPPVQVKKARLAVDGSW